MINTVVSQGFEIASISFASNYEEAKKARLDVFTSNVYSGPEMETLSQELHESFYGFIEKELGITDSLLEDFTDYCMDKEQHFYIEWLKDLKSVIWSLLCYTANYTLITKHQDLPLIISFWFLISDISYSVFANFRMLWRRRLKAKKTNNAVKVSMMLR